MFVPFAFMGPKTDADADAFLADVVSAGGTINTTIEDATQTLFISLKKNGLYSKLDLFYPFIGGVAASNALNGNRTNSAYDITWNGSLTFNSNGVTGTGTNGDYGNTNYNPNTQASPTNTAWGIYGTNGNFGDNGGEVYSFGAYDGNEINNHRREDASNVGLYGYDVGSARNTIAVASTSDGQYTATFDSSNVKTIYFNADVGGYATSNTTAGGTVALTNQPYYLFTLNINGSPYSGNYWDGRLSFFWVGEYLNTSEVETINDIITVFNTNLGRNVY